MPRARAVTLASMSAPTRTTRPTSRRTSVAPLLCWAAFVLAVAANLYGIYAPSQPGPALFAGADKVWHLLSFALVMGTGVLAGIHARWLAAALVAHAIVSELIQHLVLAGRSGDPVDVVADLVGIGIGWALGHLLARRLRRLRARRAGDAPAHADDPGAAPAASRARR